MPEMETRFWELSVGELNKPISVKGRLKANLAFWRDVLQAPPAVLKVIESGYVLPLMSEPVPFSGNNHMSAVQNVQFVNESVQQLLCSGCVSEVQTAPVIISPLSVVENAEGKKRLVLNLRHLNKFLFKKF